MPIFGSSMEPTLQTGSLMIIEPVDPSELEVGDIVVFNVSGLVREYYNYPAVIAHRIIKINQEEGLTFRTKGDNTGEDPFAIRASAIRGRVGKLIPNLGYPLLFFQSQQGVVFVIVALSLLTFFLYGGEIVQGRRKLQRGIFAPLIEETHRTSRVLTQKIETTEQKMDTTQQALEKFSAAIELYATHLASHTSAIQGLSEASHELKRSAADQNKVITRLMENMGQMQAPHKEEAVPVRSEESQSPQREALISKVDKVMEELEKTAYPPGCVKNKQESAVETNYRRLHPRGN